MTETRDKLDALINQVTEVGRTIIFRENSDNLREEFKRLLDDLSDEAFNRGIQAEIDAHSCD
jgi:hypothetical protein